MLMQKTSKNPFRHCGLDPHNLLLKDIKDAKLSLA